LRQKELLFLKESEEEDVVDEKDVTNGYEEDDEDTAIWKSRPIQVWTLPKGPCGITYDGTYLYVCDPNNNRLLQYTLRGHLADTWTSTDLAPGNLFNLPVAMDISQDLIYVMGFTQLQILNLKKEIVNHWELPSVGYGVKVDENYVYVTVENHYQIFVYNKLGFLEKKFGKEEKGENPREFHCPYGLALDEKYLYICDLLNHRVQVLNKENGLFSHQWGTQGTNDGQFMCPYSIHIADSIVYVGDQMSVQLFTTQGIFIQRLGQDVMGSDEGQFNNIYGLTVVNDRLYVSGFGNNRIQVFRKIKRTKSQRS